MDIVITGNTVIDALLESVERVKNIKDNSLIDELKKLEEGDEIVLVTGY